uniref:Tic20 family protein n=1 Tax=Cyanothece sp. (strain PCC 7425 / ATCC 29141) TaxID=395961 RepID=B8HR61_CYAP4
MNWRATATLPERIFSTLPYLLPLVFALPFGQSLFRMFPLLQYIIVPLLPILVVYQLPLASLAIFMGLYLLVVRNDRISYFIRYNTMQALLLDIALFLVSLGYRLLGGLPGIDFMLTAFANFLFIATLAVVVYAIVQCLRGLYPEIPTISDAAKSQVF